MSRRELVWLVAWSLIVATATLLLIASSPLVARGDVCCVTCHEPASCADCHAPEPELELEPDAAPADFDPDALTRSQWGPDGRYYLFVPYDMPESQAFAPGGIQHEAELVAGDHEIVTVGPGSIYSEDAVDADLEDPSWLLEDEPATEATVTP